MGGVYELLGQYQREEEGRHTDTERAGRSIGVDHEGMFVQLPNGAIVYAVRYPKYECYVAIRKLTPRECFRLQGWEDEYFERAAMVNSDSQLYKQAGNGVTVNVVEVIGKRLKEIEKEKEQ